MRRYVCLLALFFPLSALLAQNAAAPSTAPQASGSAQEAPQPGSSQQSASDSGASKTADGFPLALLLDAAQFAGDKSGTWRPDWPLDLPPDSFKVQSGEILGAAIQGKDISLSIKFGSDGQGVLEFPFMLNGKMAQVDLVYEDAEIDNPDSVQHVKEIDLSFPSGAGEDPWKLEILTYQDTYPCLIRASKGGSWYFIVLSTSEREILETWYDEKGNALSAYKFSLTEIGKTKRIRMIQQYPLVDDSSLTECFYDSRGFLTEYSGSRGDYRVLYYREDLPRYWDRQSAKKDSSAQAASAGNQPSSDSSDTGASSNSGDSSDIDGSFSLQWDEAGLLQRIAQISVDAPVNQPDSTGSQPNGKSPVDYRYEYTLDDKGNWIERREIQMISGLGLLVPSEGPTLTRTLEYKEQE